MNLKLTVNEDAELRAYIKDLIRGQVRSIMKEEYEAIVKEHLANTSKRIDKEIDTAIAGTLVKHIDAEVRLKIIDYRDKIDEEFRKTILTIVENWMNTTYFSSPKDKHNLRSLVEDAVKDLIKKAMKE